MLLNILYLIACDFNTNPYPIMLYILLNVIYYCYPYFYNFKNSKPNKLASLFKYLLLIFYKCYCHAFFLCPILPLQGISIASVFKILKKHLYNPSWNKKPVVTFVHPQVFFLGLSTGLFNQESSFTTLQTPKYLENNL